VELYHIGQIAENSNELKYFADHKSVRLNEHGFDHFA
jgi:hypothetical protein